jgi:hypothetical protein
LKKLHQREEQQHQSGRKPRGKAPKPPQEGPGDSAPINFTDPESRVMKAGSGQHFEQAYDKRKSTIEPVFGIIKEALGFRRFSLRGKVNLEWKLVSLSYNLKRLFHMGAKLQSA